MLRKKSKPETLSTEPVENVYAIANRHHTNWGLKEMPPVKIYHSTTKITRPEKIKPTRKGKNFIEALMEYHAKIPGPKYSYPSFWSSPSDRSKSPTQVLKPQGSRKTFLDAEQQRSSRIPGVGQYETRSTQSKSFSSEKAHHTHQMQAKRRNYFENYVAQQIDNPGPGGYREAQKPVKSFKFKPTKSRSPPPKKGPSSATYHVDDPTYFTFDKPQTQKAAPKVHKCKCAKCVKPQKNSSPGPCLGHCEPKQGWMNKVSKAPQFSIYYEHS